MYDFIENQRGKLSFKTIIISLVALFIVSSSGFYLFRWAEEKGSLSRFSQFLTKIKADKAVIGSQALSFTIDLGQADLDIDQVLDDSEIKIIDALDRQMEDNFEVKMVAVEGDEYQIEVLPKHKNVFRPGRYHIEAKFETPQGVRDYSQDFYWGVLAFNSNKSMYLPGEEAFLQFGVLDEMGDTVCKAELELVIRSEGKIKKVMRNTYDSNELIKDDIIINNPECLPNNVIDMPDYYAYYELEEPGIYEFELTATTKKGSWTLEEYIEVKEDILFELERIGPTRIYPLAEYEMQIEIKANQDYQGEVKEFMPDSFEVTSDELIKVESKDGVKEVSWQVDWQAGQSYELSYIMDAPDISPEFYLLGPFKIGNWQEAREWQIANDAAISTGIIVAWPGTTSMPGGWQRVAALDSKYLEGTNTNPGAGGGNDTHTHPQNSHQHSIEHNHGGSGTSGANTGTGVTTKNVTASGAQDAHTHNYTIGTNTGENNLVEDTNFGTGTNHPAYRYVIWIESIDGSTEIPDGALAFFNNGIPSGWTATSSDLFLRGAAVGTDGGGGGDATSPGSSDHDHIDAGHTHDEAAHNHTITITSLNHTEVNSDTKNTNIAGIAHTHAISDGSQTATEDSGVADVATADAQPPWYKLQIVENTSGGNDTPQNIIAAWDQIEGDVPTGWVECDGTDGTPDLNDRFIKGAASEGEVGNTSGAISITHTHAAGTPHTHNVQSHTHTYTVGSALGTADRGNKLTGDTAAPADHTHTITVTGSFTTGNETVAVTLTANTDNRPPYEEVIFIQYRGTNNQPAVTAADDNPDPIGVGAELRFTVNWADSDAGDLITSIICKGSGITTSTLTCKDGEWTRGVATNRDPDNQIVYTTQATDLGSTHDYWVFACDDTGNPASGCSTAYTWPANTFQVANQTPDAPVSLLVNGIEVGHVINILQSPAATFSGVYKDSNDEGDVAVNYCIEVDTQSNFLGTQMWASDSDDCNTGTGLASNLAESDRMPDIAYAGSALADATTYYWRMWFWDGSVRSDTSAVGWFVMASDSAGAGPRLRGDVRLKGDVRLQ